MPQSHRCQYLIAIFRSRFPDTRAANLAFALQYVAQYADRHAGNTMDRT
jgi:hypothetical protein